MARIIIHTRGSPLVHRTPKGDVVVICMCGLSGNYPFCDGSHLKTDGEEGGAVYVYDSSGKRRGRAVKVEMEEGVIGVEDLAAV